MILRVIHVCWADGVVDRSSIALRRCFGPDATVVEELYRFLIRGRVRTKDEPQVMFMFSDLTTAPPENVYTMNCVWPFDFSRYSELAQIDSEPIRGQRKRMILDALQEGLLWMSSQLGWEQQPFVDAHAAALERNLVLQATLKKSWVSPNKRFRAYVHFVLDSNGVVFEAVLHRNRTKQEVARKHFCTVEAYLGCVREYAGEVKWSNTTTFSMTTTSAHFTRQHWEVDFREEMQQ